MLNKTYFVINTPHCRLCLIHVAVFYGHIEFTFVSISSQYCGITLLIIVHFGNCCYNRILNIYFINVGKKVDFDLTNAQYYYYCY